jgi:hypothetical protein
MRTNVVFLVALTIACLVAMHCVNEASLAASTPAELQAASPTASTTELKAGLGIENMDLTGAADSFKVAPDTKIYAWARVKDVAAGSSVSLAFKKGDKEVYRKEITIPSVPYRIDAYRTFRSGDAGDWKIILAGADGKELASTDFKVEIAK